MMLSTKDKVQQYIATYTGSKIDIVVLSKKFGVTRQRIWSILQSLGETRHQRVPKEKKHCATCNVVISNNAEFCRLHSKGNVPKISGHFYVCRVCDELKVLEQFARNRQYTSGYDTRCLDCRALWQREYHATQQGRQNHAKASKAISDRHPERQRAYYQVYQAIKKGTLVKLPCNQCQNPKTRAVQTDYNDPLNVIWLCSLCNHRNPAMITPYEPDEFEESLREFLNQTANALRWSSKWFKILKTYYKSPKITPQILKASIVNSESINGLGPSYKDQIEKFLGHIDEPSRS